MAIRSFLHHLHHCRGGTEAARRRRGRRVWRAARLEEPSCAIGDAVAPPAMLPEPDGMPRFPPGACASTSVEFR
jgi:hypothetical protein